MASLLTSTERAAPARFSNFSILRCFGTAPGANLRFARQALDVRIPLHAACTAIDCTKTRLDSAEASAPRAADVALVDQRPGSPTARASRASRAAPLRCGRWPADRTAARTDRRRAASARPRRAARSRGAASGTLERGGQPDQARAFRPSPRMTTSSASVARRSRLAARAQARSRAVVPLDRNQPADRQHRRAPRGRARAGGPRRRRARGAKSADGTASGSTVPTCAPPARRAKRARSASLTKRSVGPVAREPARDRAPERDALEQRDVARVGEGAVRVRRRRRDAASAHGTSQCDSIASQPTRRARAPPPRARPRTAPPPARSRAARARAPRARPSP